MLGRVAGSIFGVVGWENGLECEKRERDGRGVVVVVAVADKTMYGMTMWRVLDDMTRRWKRIGRKWKFVRFGAGERSS